MSDEIETALNNYRLAVPAAFDGNEAKPMSACAQLRNAWIKYEALVAGNIYHLTPDQTEIVATLYHGRLGHNMETAFATAGFDYTNVAEIDLDIIKNMRRCIRCGKAQKPGSILCAGCKAKPNPPTQTDPYLQYWETAVDEAFSEAGLPAPYETVNVIAEHMKYASEMYSEAFGYDKIPNPIESRHSGELAEQRRVFAAENDRFAKREAELIDTIQHWRRLYEGAMEGIL